MYRCRHFKIQELVGPEVFAALGEEGCWRLLDEGALRTLDALRDRFGPCTVNDWDDGGRFKESGLRDFGTTTGAKRSQHKYGRAFDCKFKLVSPAFVSEYILKHRAEFPFLTTLEDVRFTPTWLHFDTRNHSGTGILIVRP